MYETPEDVNRRMAELNGEGLPPDAVGIMTFEDRAPNGVVLTVLNHPVATINATVDETPAAFARRLVSVMRCAEAVYRQCRRSMLGGEAPPHDGPDIDDEDFADLLSRMTPAPTDQMPAEDLMKSTFGGGRVFIDGVEYPMAAAFDIELVPGATPAENAERVEQAFNSFGRPQPMGDYDPDSRNKESHSDFTPPTFEVESNQQWDVATDTLTKEAVADFSVELPEPEFIE